jgi:4-aminobutyrate aminotransferase
VPSFPAAGAAAAPAGRLSEAWFSVTDLKVESAAGCWVRSTDGRRYLDFTSGIGVTSTGHCHPMVVAAMQAQLEKFIHAQVNVYRHDLLEPLVSALAAVTPHGIDTFFLCNSGAEAVEGAVKLAKRATGKPNIVVFSGAFHGRTHLTMGMSTSGVGIREGYGPLPSGIFVAPFASREEETESALAGLQSVLRMQTGPAEIAAVVIEPVLGELGYLPAAPNFVRGIRRLCDEHGILLIADEVQTGFGRSGRMFAVDHYGIEPDILTMSKGMGSGFPIAGIGASAEIMRAWPAGSHGSTYGGNPVGCAAVLATIDVIADAQFLEAVRARGSYLRSRLEVVSREFPEVVSVRGLGVMIGVEFATPALTDHVARHCLEQGGVILMRAGSPTALRWIPPLIATEEELGIGLDAYSAALAAWSC